ncbi:MAG: zinc ABC transporter substrate-binding protein [Oscillospiraceae bacterium]|nr:zinc ABC transporter substrate-binding protein [Candidatus Equicaccousia limihippi]
MRKIIAFLLSVSLLACLFCGCSGTTVSNKKYSVVTTVFPEYEWTKEIIGDRITDFDLTMLIDSGVDLHSFQPTASDMLKISNCDLFIYIGGESDKWVEDAIEQADNDKMITLNLLEVLGKNAKSEETVEGMQAEEEEEEEAYDEHVWLSLKNAALFCEKIKDALAQIDAENASVYDTNCKQYTDKINDLDVQYKSAADGAKTKTLLFCDRFPFRYLTDDYGLSYYAAFSGCSAESEASFETVDFLANKVKELSLNSVIVLESSDKKIANTVIKESGKSDVAVLSLDSMQSATQKDVGDGATYLSVMQKNLEVLKKALGE